MSYRSREDSIYHIEVNDNQIIKSELSSLLGQMGKKTTFVNLCCLVQVIDPNIQVKRQLMIGMEGLQTLPGIPYLSRSSQLSSLLDTRSHRTSHREAGCSP